MIDDGGCPQNAIDRTAYTAIAFHNYNLNTFHVDAAFMLMNVWRIIMG